MTISKSSLRDAIGRPIERSSTAELVPGGGGGIIEPDFEATKSVLLGGGSEYINCEQNGNFDYDEPWSFSFWMKLTSSGSWKNIFAKISAGRGIVLHKTDIQKPRVALEAGSGNSLLIAGNASIPVGTWINLIFTYSGSGSTSGMDLYYNGSKSTPYTLSNSGSMSSIINANPLKFPDSATATAVDANVCELAFYDIKLSDSDAAAIAAGPNDLRLLASGSNLVSWLPIGNWHFENWLYLIPNRISGAPYAAMVNMSTSDIVEDAP